MDLQRLRDETRREHEATEAAMPLMEPGLTMEVYVSVLQTLLPLLQSWEAWAGEHAPTSLQPLLADRRRSHLLEEDLRSLGGAEPHPAQESADVDWADLTTPRERSSSSHDGDDATASQAAFLGALYVLEGSTLGGRIIARHVNTAFSFHDGKGLTYFRGHGDQTGSLWKQVTEMISALPEEHSRDVIEAARRTFHAFQAALEAGQHRPVRPVLAHGERRQPGKHQTGGEREDRTGLSRLQSGRK